MNFGKNEKFYFLANLNNVGANVTGDLNQLIRPFRFDEPGSIGDDQTANKLLNINVELPNLKQKRVNFNNSEMLSLNSIFTLSKKVKLKAIGILNTDEVDFFKNSMQFFTLGTSNFENTENFVGRKSEITGFGKIDVTYDISKDKTLEYTGKFNTTEERNRSNLLFNTDFLNEKLTTNNQLIDQKLVVTNKLKKNKVLLFSGRYINEKTPQNYSVNQFIFDDLFTENANNTKQFSQNKMEFFGFETHLLDRKENQNLLELKIGNQLRIDNLNTSFELQNNNTILSLPIGFQNDLKYTTNNIYLNTKYTFNYKNIAVTTQSNFYQLFNSITNVASKTSQNAFFIIPKIDFEWKINKKNKILTSYSNTTTNASILDVYSGFIQTGFRSFNRGVETFNQLNATTTLFNYNYGSWGDKFFANFSVMYTKDNDFFSSNSIIMPNYSQTEKILIQDKALFSISSNIDKYLKPIKSNLKFSFIGSNSNFKNSVNNTALREVKILSAEYGLQLRSGFRGFFNYHVGSTFNYNQIKTSIQNSFTDNMTFLDLSFIFNKKFNIQLQSERYFFGNLEKTNNKYYFLDIETRYVVKENKLTFSLSGNNLFNTTTFKNYSISDVNISKTEYRLLPRFLLLTMEFRF